MFTDKFHKEHYVNSFWSHLHVRVFICRALLLSFYLQAAGEARGGATLRVVFPTAP
jgi:hypothetical protein